MSDIKKEFGSFEQFLKMYMKNVKVRSITRNYLSAAINSGYGNYPIESFLLLYKLSRMEELGVVSEEIANNLRELLDMKMHVGAIIGEEAKRALYDPSYNSDALSKLHKTVDTINSNLKRYHLTIDDINFTDMIDASIKEENKEIIKKGNNIRKRTE